MQLCWWTIKVTDFWQEDAFREKYKIQLRLYKEALERVTDLPVKACYIYAFAPGKTIPIDFD